VYIEPQDQEKAHKKYLLDFSGKVEMMLVSKPSLKRLLKRQCKLCEKKYDEYYHWLEAQHEVAKKNPCLLDENAGNPPKRGYILQNGWWRKPDRKDLPDITSWFYPYTNTPKTSRRPNVEEQLMCSCVLIAIVHDNVLQNSQQEPIYFTPKEVNLTSFQNWTHSILGWMNELMKMYAPENRERVAKEIQIMLDAALVSIQKLKKSDLASKQKKENEHSKQPSSSKADLLNGKPWWSRWLWELYERTLKVFVDAIMERFWPKSK
jgi:hypothetical protein